MTPRDIAAAATKVVEQMEETPYNAEEAVAVLRCAASIIDEAAAADFSAQARAAYRSNFPRRPR
jgi:hypothetical protein